MLNHETYILMDMVLTKGFQIFLSDEPIYDGNTITGIKDIQRQNVNVDDNYYTLDEKKVSSPTFYEQWSP